MASGGVFHAPTLLALQDPGSYLSVAIVLLLVTHQRPISGQDLSQMTAREFVTLEQVHQYAVAGAVLGMIIGITDAADQTGGEPGSLSECLGKWQAESPETYVSTLTTSWVEMTELNAVAAELGDSVTAAQWGELPIAASFASLLLMSCGLP